MSDIVTIDYATLRDRISLRGEPYGFFSDADGRNQLTPFGTRMVTSSKQGWAFEIDSEGKIGNRGVGRLHIAQVVLRRRGGDLNKSA